MKKLNRIITLKFLIFLSLLLFQGNAESKQSSSDIYIINVPTNFTTPCSIKGQDTGLHQKYYEKEARGSKNI